MTALEEPGLEPAQKLRTLVRVDGSIVCPCSTPLDKSEIGTFEIADERTAPDALAELDSGVLFRGWECGSDTCNRVVLDTVKIAREDNRERELRDGWYPITVDLDVGESVVGFAPKPHVDELLGCEVGDE